MVAYNFIFPTKFGLRVYFETWAYNNVENW